MDRRTVFLPTAWLWVLLCAATGKTLPPAPWGGFGPNPAYPNFLGPAYPMKQGPLINAFDYPGPDTVPNYWYSSPYSADGSFYYKPTEGKKTKKSKKLDSDKKLGKYGKRDMFDAPLGYDSVPNLTPAYFAQEVPYREKRSVASDFPYTDSFGTVSKSNDPDAGSEEAASASAAKEYLPGAAYGPYGPYGTTVDPSLFAAEKSSAYLDALFKSVAAATLPPAPRSTVVPPDFWIPVTFNFTAIDYNKKVSDFLDKLFDALKPNKTAPGKAKRDGGQDNFEDESEDRARRQHARAVSVRMHQGYQSLPAGAVESVQAGGGAVPGHQGGGIKLFDTDEYEDSLERFDWTRYPKDEREKHEHHRNRH